MSRPIRVSVNTPSTEIAEAIVCMIEEAYSEEQARSHGRTFTNADIACCLVAGTPRTRLTRRLSNLLQRLRIEG